MKILLHKNYLGTECHLMVDDHSFKWCDDLDTSVWTVGYDDCPKSLDIISRIMSYENVSIIDESHLNSFVSLMTGSLGTSVPWHFVYDHTVYNERLKRVISNSQNIVSELESHVYTKYWLKSHSFLLSLKSSLIDNDKLEHYKSVCDVPTIKKSLQSFEPNKNGYCDNITYNMVGTSTGRLTVKSGPSILTLPAAKRDILKSRYDGGKIGYIDCVSLEPRILKYTVGDTPPLDIYSHILNEYNSVNVSRDLVKKITIAMLYGSSLTGLSNIAGEGVNIQKLSKFIREYFHINDLLDYLKTVYRDKSQLTNLVGRPLHVKDDAQNLWINHFIQSSAVDVSLCGFYDLLENVKSKNLNVVPLYSLHDALIVDVHLDDIKSLQHIVDAGITNELGNFPLKLTLM